jgi:large subunit ribosomal protein L10
LAYVTKVRPEKEAVVNQLVDWLEKSKSAVFFSFEGITSQNMQLMRAELKKSGLPVKVVKNTLLELAIKKLNMKADDSLFRGTTAILLSENDELAAFKSFVEQSKKYDMLKVKGGILEGQWVPADEVEVVAALPGKQELLAQVVGTIASPIRGLVTVFSGPYRNLVYVLKGIKDKKAA